MARSKKAFCSSCDSRVSTGVSFCPSCEQPLPWASFEERRAWELAQWQKKRTTARKPAQARAAERVERPKKFEHATPARSAPEPIRRVVEPKTPRTVASKPSPKVAPKPGRKAPKMAPMTVPAPAPDKTHANGNGSVNGASHDTTGEQTEILRELLRRVIAIEEKMANGAPKLRRLRLLKR